MEKNRLPYQIQEMLQDQDVYTPTDKRRNPASRAEFELQRKLLDLKKLGNLNETDYYKFRLSDSTSVSFYGSPMIHRLKLQQLDDHLSLTEGTETRMPLRPINICIGSPTYFFNVSAKDISYRRLSQSLYCKKFVS